MSSPLHISEGSPAEDLEQGVAESAGEEGKKRKKKHSKKHTEDVKLDEPTAAIEEKKIETSDLYKEFEVQQASDFIFSHDTPYPMRLCIVLIYTVQMLVLSYAFASLKNNLLHDYDMGIICIGGLFAALAILCEGFHSAQNAICLILGLLMSIIERSISERFWYTDSFVLLPFNVLVLMMECGVVYFSFVTLIYVVVQQNSILDIVVNSTAIICVSKLDDALFEKFPATCKVLREFDRAKILRVDDDWVVLAVRKYSPIVAAGLVYLAICLTANEKMLEYHCKEDPNCTN